MAEQRPVHWGRTATIVGGVLALGVVTGEVSGVDMPWDDDDNDRIVRIEDRDGDRSIVLGGGGSDFDRDFEAAQDDVRDARRARLDRLEELTEDIDEAAEEQGEQEETVDAIADRLGDLGERLKELEDEDDPESLAERERIKDEMQDEAADLARVGLGRLGERLGDLIEEAERN